MNRKKDNNKHFKNPYLWAGALLLIFVLGLFSGSSKPELPYSEFITQVQAHNVKSATIYRSYIDVNMKDGGSYYVTTSAREPFIGRYLSEQGVQVVYAKSGGDNIFLALLVNWLPFLIIFGLIFFFSMRMQGGGPLSFSKSKAKLKDDDENKVTFKDVAGVEEAKKDVQEVVEFLKDPSRFERIGGKVPKGILMVGPPGTGKTLLARAVAGEAHVPFFSISGSDFVEMFVGVGASRVRDLFAQAQKSAPCLVFIDEIDAVGRHRGAGLGGGNDEREQTLNQLLVEMDGFSGNKGVIVIAATNRPDVLDPALLRPGRFDRQVIVNRPYIKDREEILKVHMQKVKLASDVDVATIAKGTPGFSGADLANLVNEAALIAARHHKRKVEMVDFDQAKDKIFMGPEKRSVKMTTEEIERTAYHEAGHAIVQLKVGNVDPIYKATIVPRGFALGAVFSEPQNDTVSRSRANLLGDITVAYGGRIAEEEFFGYNGVTTGAANDIMQATKMARSMVVEWGLSDLGPIMYEEPEEEVFLGHSVTQRKNISGTTAAAIDTEVKKILDSCYTRSRDIITKYKEDLKKIATELLKHETLTGQELIDLLAGKKINPSLKSPSLKNSPPENEVKQSALKAVPTKDYTLELEAKDASLEEDSDLKPQATSISSPITKDPVLKIIRDKKDKPPKDDENDDS